MKKYSEWLSENEENRVDRRDLLTQEQLDWCEKHIHPNIDWWVNENGEVQVHKSLWFRDKDNITGFPVQFADVKGDFDCDDCANLTSLKGSPKIVGGKYTCYYDKKLVSLEGAPEKVGGDFSCGYCNSLKTLEGAPKVVKDDFVYYYCDDLTSLMGAPEEVGGDIMGEGCKKLVSLEGFPKVFEDVYCEFCDNLPQVEQDFLGDEELQDRWKKSPLDWQKFMYTSGAAKGRKFGL